LGQLLLTLQTQGQLKLVIESKLSRLKQTNGLKVNNGIRRDRMEILAEILLYCGQLRGKTSIMYNTNLNYTQLQTHLSLLTSLGMLTHKQDRYVTTEKGYRFLELFTELQGILEETDT
jgi:predicted transcriptional regulator